jgi:F-type H+-transporting ATPase subunit b
MSEILTILGSVGFNWHVALANFFNFLIILFLLNKFFFRKIGATLKTRQDVIKRGLDQAHNAEKILANAEEEKVGIVKAAYKERDSLVAKGQALADDIVARKQEEADEKIHARLIKLAEEEASISETVEQAFRKKAPNLVAALYAKTLMTEMSEADNNALIARMRS